MKKKKHPIVPIQEPLFAWVINHNTIFAWDHEGDKRKLYNSSENRIVIEGGKIKVMDHAVCHRLGLTNCES